jgi:uncharacterized protein YhaN
MRICGWHIDGFGVFAGCTVEDLPPALTIVHGPNEAGKSTMLAFVRGVLFGFPDGRSSERRYPPLRGGQPGGRLLIEADGLGWVVERSGSPSHLTVTLPGGSLGSKDDLSLLLGGADKELFRNIFAFSLEELSEFHALQGEQVRERIFATPVIGAARSPSEAVRALDSRRARLLKPRASCEINELKKLLRETLGAMHDAQRAAASYPRAVREEQDAAEEVDRLSQTWRATQVGADKFEKLIAVWPDWSERSSDVAELDHTQVPGGVSPEAAQRLDGALVEIREARRGLNERQKELTGHVARLERVPIDDRLPPLAPEVKALADRLSVYESDLQRLSEVKVARETEESRLGEELGVLGPTWARERVVNLDISIPRAEEVRAWSSRISEASEQERRLTDLVEASRDKVATCLTERARLEAERDNFANVQARQDLEGSERAARRLSALMAERATAEAKVDYAAKTLEDRRIMVAALPKRVPSPRAPRTLLLVLGAVLALGAVAMVAARQWAAAGGLGVAAVAIVVVGVRGYTTSGPASYDVGPGPGVGDRLKEAEASLGRQKSQLQDLDAQVAKDAAELGLAGPPSALDVEEVRGRIDKELVARARADELSRQLDAVLADTREKEGRLVGLETELETARGSSSTLTEEWGLWRTAKGVPEPLAPELVTDVFTSVHRCRESLGQLRTKENEERELRRRAEDFESAAGKVLVAAGEAGATGTALSTALRVLHGRVLDDEVARKNRGGIEEAIGGTRRDVEEVEVELEVAERRRAEILTEAGATDEAELREFVSNLVRRGQLEEGVESCDRRIKAQIGKGPDADELRAELETGALSEWELRRQELTEQASELHTQRDQAVRRHQDAKQATAQIGESWEVARLETEAEGMRQQLAGAVGQWQTAALARSLIEATLSRFEKEHQPKVVARASTLFKGVTSGRYRHLVAREGILEALDENDVRINAADLSTGTVQQLYLCVRFGLAEEFAERGTSLPLIMDEVLVNFDPERSRAMAAAIGDVATRRQVLLFTCHPETVEIMKDVSPGTRVVELARYGAEMPAPRSRGAEVR